MKSHRVVWTQKGVAEVQPFEPSSPAEGEALIQTRVTLVSPGTERAFFLCMPNAACEFPVYQPGYNNVGEVIQVGAKVDGLKSGQRVACAAGHASHVVFNAADCLPLSEDAADEDAVFFNMATISLQGVRKARIELGESVIVIGAGPIGLLAMQLAKLQGALPVLMVDKDKNRLEFAQKMGADVTLVSDDQLSSNAQKHYDGQGAAVVIEASGHPQAIVTAFQLAGQFGRGILLGSTRGETEKVNFYRDVHHKGLTVIGAHNFGSRPRHESHAGWWTMRDDQRMAVKLLALKRLNVQPLITHRFKWNESSKAYALLARFDLNAQGMLLDWRDA